MSDWEFIKDGYFWGQPLWKRVYLNFIYWFKGLWLFIKCLWNYEETIYGNELTILDAWGLCFSIQDMRMGKRYKVIIHKDGGTTE